jgi:predicted DNA-binding transcriptional regulator AlpA
MRDPASVESARLSSHYLRQPQVLAFLGIARPTFWRLRQKHRELEPIRLSARLLVWDRRVIEAWIEGRRAVRARLRPE